MERVELESRILRATELFKQGYNCSQSVVGAYADLYGYRLEQALLMSASFGGGIGRMREVCGAACGMFLLAGFECGCLNPTDNEGKGHNYKVVQELAAAFKKENGSMICAELLGLRPMNGNAAESCKEVKQEIEITHIPQERTAEYYKKRPCIDTVKSAVRIYGEYLIRSRN